MYNNPLLSWISSGITLPVTSTYLLMRLSSFHQRNLAFYRARFLCHKGQRYISGDIRQCGEVWYHLSVHRTFTLNRAFRGQQLVEYGTGLLCVTVLARRRPLILLYSIQALPHMLLNCVLVFIRMK